MKNSTIEKNLTKDTTELTSKETCILRALQFSADYTQELESKFNQENLLETISDVCNLSTLNAHKGLQRLIKKDILQVNDEQDRYDGVVLEFTDNGQIVVETLDLFDGDKEACVIAPEMKQPSEKKPINYKTKMDKTVDEIVQEAEKINKLDKDIQVNVKKEKTAEPKSEAKQPKEKKATKKDKTAKSTEMKVTLRAFTKMIIGEFTAKKVNGNWEITTKHNGVNGTNLIFGTDGKQINCKNPRYANYIEFIA